MKPPIAELERRRPVWDVMSEFFLDTQLLADDHARIARRLDESGYALAELEQILWHEVSPALWWNLTSVRASVGSSTWRRWSGRFWSSRPGLCGGG